MKINFDIIFPYLVAGGLSLMFLLVGVLIYLFYRNSKHTVDYDAQLQELLADDDEIATKAKANTKVSLTYRWNHYWANTLKGAGVVRYQQNSDNAGRDMTLLAIFSFVLIAAVTRNLIVGLIAPVVLIYGLSVLMKMKYHKKNEELNQQIPGFLFSLKANIQASDTNERAMIKVIDLMPKPLYDDLVVVKKKLLSNSTFKEALEEMSKKTTSRDLQFLAACMIQASSSGASMVTQIDSIQKVLEERRKVNSEIARAVKGAQPAIWLASFAIPGLFLASYTSDISARNFWFIEPISWIVLAVAGVLYGLALFFTKRAVDAIKNL